MPGGAYSRPAFWGMDDRHLSSNPASKAPPKCNQAITRLERAIARLERAAQTKPRGSAESGQLEADLLKMREITQSVAQRLDQTIGRVRVALES